MSFITFAQHVLNKSLGLHLSRYHFERDEHWRTVHWAKAVKAETILDIGANTGQFASHVLSCGFRGTILSFEPLEEPHRKLLLSSKRHGNWIVAERCALGRSDGEATIHVAGNSASSSLFAMHDNHIKADPSTAPIGTERIALRRLDGFLTDDRALPRPFFAKIDTQGFELEVLAGASGCLSDISGLLVESSLVPLYHGAPLISDVIQWARDHGFTPVDLTAAFISPDGQTLQVNLFMTRAS